MVKNKKYNFKNKYIIKIFSKLVAMIKVWTLEFVMEWQPLKKFNNINNIISLKLPFSKRLYFVRLVSSIKAETSVLNLTYPTLNHITFA